MGKPKMGPFALFVNEQKRSNPELWNKSNQEAFVLAGPLWDNLTVREKDVYIKRAKKINPRDCVSVDATKESNNNVKVHNSDKASLGFDHIGRPLVDILKRDRDLVDAEDARTRLVEDLVGRAVQNGSIESTVFHVMHANIFVRTPDTNTIVPAEIAVTKFSIEEGIIDTIHAFTEPGKIPSGYKYKCIENSDFHHKIPLFIEKKPRTEDPNSTLVPELSYTPDEEIISELTKFLGGSDLIFCMSDNIDDCKDVIDVLTSRSKLPTPKLKYVLLLDLVPCLTSPIIPNTYVASQEMDKQRFMYNKDMLCTYHDAETDTNKCSKAFVKSWCFTILTFTNTLFHVCKVERKHFPDGLGTDDAVNDDDWEVQEKRKVAAGSVRSYGHGDFASSDIRYRNDDESNTSESVNVSNMSDIMAKTSVSDFDSEYELPESSNISTRSSVPTSSRSSIMSESSRPVGAGAGRGLLLQSLRSQRSSRMAANLN